jgi:hypothetical protein
MGLLWSFLVSAYAILIEARYFSIFGASSIILGSVFQCVWPTGSSAVARTIWRRSPENDFAQPSLATQNWGSGFWTSDSLFGPLLHLGGIVAVLPTLYLLYQKRWQGQPVPASQITLALPLNAIPLLLCRGIPSLQAAALVAIVGGLMQVLNLKNADRQSKMRI